MSTTNIIACAANIGLGLLLIVISFPLLRGTIGKNQIYGFRFGITQSEEDWQHINKYGAKWLIIWSIVLIIVGVITIVLPLKNLTVAIIWAVVPVTIISTIVILQTYVYANRK